MSDNPLADWLGAHDDGEGEPDPAPHEPGEEGVPARWPDWASPAAVPSGPETATWAQPPDEDPTRGLPRRRLLLLAAALPWAAAGALGLAVVGSGATPATDESAATVDPALGAAAALAVRLAATTAAEQDDPGADRRYVDLAVPEALTWAGDVAVVTVAAVVLEGHGDRWHTSRPARFAVPLHVVDGRPAALGAPWPLALAERAAEPQGWEPADADHDDVARALSAAGYTDIGAMDVEARGASGTAEQVPLLRAHVQARAPGETDPRGHRLWLRTEPEPAVLGADHPRAERGRP